MATCPEASHTMLLGRNPDEESLTISSKAHTGTSLGGHDETAPIRSPLQW